MLTRREFSAAALGLGAGEEARDQIDPARELTDPDADRLRRIVRPANIKVEN